MLPCIFGIITPNNNNCYSSREGFSYAHRWHIRRDVRLRPDEALADITSDQVHLRGAETDTSRIAIDGTTPANQKNEMLQHIKATPPYPRCASDCLTPPPPRQNNLDKKAKAKNRSIGRSHQKASRYNLKPFSTFSNIRPTRRVDNKSALPRHMRGRGCQRVRFVVLQQTLDKIHPQKCR